MEEDLVESLLISVAALSAQLVVRLGKRAKIALVS